MLTSVCIPTYKRPHLLILLVQDIFQQTSLPGHIIIVDGDSASGEALQSLRNLQTSVPMIYVPSNHPNLPFQRYLGWRIASELGSQAIVYFDDDERLPHDNVIDILVEPLGKGDVVGVGCTIVFGKQSDVSDASTIRSKANRNNPIVSLLGNSRNIAYGEMTPTGVRKFPIDNGLKYIKVGWLQGGVMALLMSAIDKNTFSIDLFATYSQHIGRAEDTFLSRRVGLKGCLMHTFHTSVSHPSTDLPKAYSHDAYQFAYTAMYSRRFVNDHYRMPSRPTLQDRWALIKSYAGNTLLAWLRAISKPSRLNFALARGTTLGAFHGLTRPPTAKRLTPHIDWWADAEEALQAAEVIQHGSS